NRRGEAGRRQEAAPRQAGAGHGEAGPDPLVHVRDGRVPPPGRERPGGRGAGVEDEAVRGRLVRLERRTVTEVKRFAGQEIRVEKVVVVPVVPGGRDGDAGPRRRGGEDGDGSAEAGASEEAGAASGAPPAGATRKAGVDDLLKEMSKPEKLSTMSKTSADWDLFKSKNADAELKEQLETSAAGNEAYLVKKDFLDRVDRRRFELEKAERDRERAQRGK
ncbi:hypothetical protein THAOC_11295, partial [Thalassiosira oceanica]